MCLSICHFLESLAIMSYQYVYHPFQRGVLTNVFVVIFRGGGVANMYVCCHVHESTYMFVSFSGGGGGGLTDKYVVNFRGVLTNMFVIIFRVSPVCF
jgi:hypothetical protein